MKSVLFVLATIAASSAFAFRFSPMVVSFETQGNRSTQVLVLENNGTEKIPVQIEAVLRTSNAKGDEVRSATSDFVIYPEQLVLLPGDKRNVRVTWSGEIKDGTEKAYRLIATQLPVDLKKPVKKAGVNLSFLLQYVASAYVVPEGATSDVKVTEANWLGEKKIRLALANDGRAHRVLRPRKLVLKSGKRVVMTLETVKELESVNLLARTRREIEINLPEALTQQKLQAELELSESSD